MNLKRVASLILSGVLLPVPGQTVDQTILMRDALMPQPVAGHRYAIDDALQSRRTFWTLIAGLIPLAQTWAIHGSKEGVPFTLEDLPLEFLPYDSARWQGVGEQAVRQFFTDWIRLKMSRESAFGEAPFFEDYVQQTLRERSQIAEALLKVGNVQQEIASILAQNKIPALGPVGSEARWNQLLFVGLPVYLARRGVFWQHTGITQLSADDTIPPIKESIGDAIGLYRVSRVLQNHAETVWNQRQVINEVVVGDPWVLNGVPSVFGIASPMGLTLGQTIFYFESEMQKGDQALRSFLLTPDDLLDGVQTMQWKDMMARPQSSLSGFDFTKLKLIQALKAKNFVSRRMAQWRVQYVRFHERMHALDVALMHQIQIGRPFRDNEEKKARAARIVTSEFRAYLSGARHSALSDPEAGLLDVMLLMEDSDGAARAANHRLFNALVDTVIAEKNRNGFVYPEITLVKNHKRTIRDQVEGQLYNVSPTNLFRLYNTLYAREVRPTAVSPQPKTTPRPIARAA